MRTVPSTFEAALLGLLARGPASGYELRKIFQTTPLAAYSDSPGAVYPALRRLEQRGYVSGRAETGARRRKPWQLTAAGRGWLRSWVTQPVTADDVARDAAGVDLRLALVDNVAPGRLPGFLREYAEAVDEYLASLRAAAAGLSDTLPASAACALDLGVHLIHARSTWCRRAAREHAR
jgi:DNA-binding PadR family transcriptional regulator